MSETLRDRVRTSAMTTRCSERWFAARESRRGVEVGCVLSLGDRRILLRRLLLMVVVHTCCIATMDICAVLQRLIYARYYEHLPPDLADRRPISLLHVAAPQNEQTSEQSRCAHRLTQMAARGENVSHSRGGEAGAAPSQPRAADRGTPRFVATVTSPGGLRASSRSCPGVSDDSMSISLLLRASRRVLSESAV